MNKNCVFDKLIRTTAIKKMRNRILYFLLSSLFMLLWTELSKEVLEITFEYLSLRDLKQCQLVCQKWSEIAQKTMYTNVQINTFDQMVRFVWSLKYSHFVPGKHLRRLSMNITFLDFARLHAKFMLTNLTLFTPCLEAIELSETCLSFWMWLKHEWDKRHLSNLGFISYPSNEYELECYNSLALGIRSSLKNLLVCDYLYPLYLQPSSQRYNFLVDHLSEFTQLEQLKIIHHSTYTLHKLDSTLDAVLKQLKSVEILLCPERESTMMLKKNDDDKMTTTAITPALNVTYLSMDISDYTEKELVYIMNKFPNVNQLELKTDLALYKNLIDEEKYPTPVLGLKILKQFSAFLSGTKRFCIQNINISNIVYLTCQLMNAIVDGDLSLQVTSENCTEIIKYKISNIIYEKDAPPNKALLMKSYCITHFISHFLSEIAPQLNELTIQCTAPRKTANSNDHDEHKRKVFKNYLRFIFDNCVRLKKLKLVNANVIRIGYQTKLNNSIKTLELDNCSYYERILYHFSVQLPSLNQLVINGLNLVNSHGTYNINSRDFYFFNMPYTCFDMITLISSTHLVSNNLFYIKLYREAGDTYYRCEKDCIQTSKAGEYYGSLTKRHTLCIHIRCKEIKKINIISSSFSHCYCIP
ncbi:uncharacterized protein B0P05DRAFT_614991 [Gilbertella persicaria]|uniref:uncharacterized protein n=1 Tax=Gilbertella persicaria TaxID=101096 RepID=UPI00221F3709|nr:uncharacterized protein B0P05DRAFT_614991 [Gilbertella persicaria]KAI8077900.1 hypothetical protein B0P05DRAFT_614991 [Gilbertella persicaria]